jgi:TolA protein
VQDSRQSTGFLLSLLLHTALVVVAVVGVGDRLKVDMDKPMYTVDLVSLNPSVDPAEGETGEAAGAPPPQAEQESKGAAEQAASIPPPPAKAEKAKPEPVRDDAKAISEKKVVEKKKPEVKEDKKPPEKQPEKKPEEKKLSKEDLLREALQDVKKDVSSKDKAKPAAPKGRDAIASDLAELRKGAGGNIYTTGGTGPGGAYGGKGKGAGGTGSGLMSVYGAIVEQAVKKNWRYPVFGSSKSVAVVLEIKIDSHGKIASSRVLTPSGKPDFDDSAMRAVAETQAVPAPPSKSVDTLRITFNLQDLRK